MGRGVGHFFYEDGHNLREGGLGASLRDPRSSQEVRSFSSAQSVRKRERERERESVGERECACERDTHARLVSCS